MNIKKIAYYSLTISLTLGATFILGLLSFGGAFAVWPVLWFAITSFLFCVAWESIVYHQNIEEGLKKIFKSDSAEMEVARLDLFEDTQEKSPSLFALRYIDKFRLYRIYQHIEPTEEIHQLGKEALQEDLVKLQKDYQKIRSQQADYHLNVKFHRIARILIHIFSGLATIAMTVGFSYLLLETFAISGLLTVSPILILPVSLLILAGGIAHGLLTLNAMRNMLKKNIFKRWFSKLSKNFEENGLNKKNIILTIGVTLLTGLAIALTICTAGTWVTIVKNTSPLFRWLKQIPNFIMQVVYPIIISISSLSFILENTSESLKSLDEIASAEKISLKNTNPILLLIFAGHLISNSLATNRVSEFFQLMAEFVAGISDFFVDLNYIISIPEKENINDQLEDHLLGGQEHSHELGVPHWIYTKCNELFFSPNAEIESSSPPLSPEIIPIEEPPSKPAKKSKSTFFKKDFCGTCMAPASTLNL